MARSKEVAEYLITKYNVDPNSTNEVSSNNVVYNICVQISQYIHVWVIYTLLICYY